MAKNKKTKVTEDEEMESSDDFAGSAPSAVPGTKPARRKAKGQIIGGVWHNGKTYGPGDEIALEDVGLPEATMQRLVDGGVISGFGLSRAGSDDEGEE